MNLREIECRILQLEECCKPDEVNLSWIDLTGLAAGNYKWGINMQTGDLYYRNSYATWSKVTGTSVTEEGELDGGFASSSYLPIQVIDGGAAIKD